MKTKNLKQSFMMALFALTVMSAQAHSWRINSDVTKKANFTDITAAMNSEEVLAGDTLYLDPSTSLTSSITVTKQVTIIGCGYLLNGAVKQATVAHLIIRAANTKVEGLEVTNAIYLDANNITLERCKLQAVQTSSGYKAPYCIIRQCFFNANTNSFIYGYGTANTNTLGWTIENCIFCGTINNSCISNLYQPTIRNNYLRSNTYPISNITQGIILNNIIMNTSNAANNVFNNCTDCTMTNNIDSKTLGSTNESQVFALEGTHDQLYRLKEDSPAKGAATDGGDCGPFSGLYPYVCSGYPLGIPYFESSNTPVHPQNGEVKLTQKVVLQGE